MPLSVRASHAVLVLVTLLKSTDVFELAAAELDRLEHAAGRRWLRMVEPIRAERFDVDRAVAADRLRDPVTWRVIGAPLCALKLPATPMSCHGST